MHGIINNLEGSCYTSKINRGGIRPIIIIVVINSLAYGAWVGVLGKIQKVWVNTTHVAKISANPKNGSNR
jgi:hypothetical protein